jgi:pimeloyl-ACP methyl ester carboxylesterase
MMRIALSKISFSVLLVAGLLITGCKKNTIDTAKKTPLKPRIELLREQEIKRENLHARTTSTVNGIDPNTLWTHIVSLVVKVYKVTYFTTNTDGTTVEASGLMLIPKGVDTVSLISFDNGTVIDPTQAASNFKDSSLIQTWVPLISALGYAVVIPDYIGYGSTANLPHPYQHTPSLATATADLINAAKEVLADTHVHWNNKLYLSGYSEGGAAAMATHRLIQEHIPSLHITASSFGAGAYDATETAKEWLNSTTDHDAFYMQSRIWVLLSFNRIYGFNRPLNTFFYEPYATQLTNNNLFTVTVPINPVNLLLPSFKNAVLNGTDTALINAMHKNDIYDWKPTSPVLLVHSTGDEQVPLFNTLHALNAMKNRGADVQYLPIENKKHAASIPDYIINTMLFFLVHE